MKKFPQKRVMITGAGSGFGRALALEFAHKGWKVAIAEIDDQRAEETARMVTAAGGEPLSIHCDVTKDEDLEGVAAAVQKAWGGIDVVVNNAGVAAAGYMEKITMDTWEWILDLNLKSVIRGCRVFIPLLAAQGGGHIVNMASNAGIANFPEMSCYNVTKAAVISLSETLRMELAPKNIGVTVICPTFFKTNLMDQFRSTDERQKKMAQGFFAKSMATAEDVAKDAMRCVEKNKPYCITQMDGKMVWRVKRFSPGLYFRVVDLFYGRGIMDRYLGS